MPTIELVIIVLYPDGTFMFAAWEPFREFIPENERDSFIKAYSKRLNSEDMAIQVVNPLVYMIK